MQRHLLKVRERDVAELKDVKPTFVQSKCILGICPAIPASEGLGPLIIILHWILR